MFEHVALCRVLNDLWFDKLHVILWFSSFIRLFISLSKLDSHSDGITQTGTIATTNSLEWKSFRLAKATFALFGWWCYKMSKWIHIFLTIYVAAAAATDGVDPWKMITRWAPENTIWRGVSTSASWFFFPSKLHHSMLLSFRFLLLWKWIVCLFLPLPIKGYVWHSEYHLLVSDLSCSAGAGGSL